VAVSTLAHPFVRTVLSSAAAARRSAAAASNFVRRRGAFNLEQQQKWPTSLIPLLRPRRRMRCVYA